jgi:hypothetical protein
VPSPTSQLREALEAYLQDTASHTLERFRTGEGASYVAQAARHGWLASDRAEDALREADGMGLLDAASREALDAHLVRVRVGAGIARVRDALEALCGREVTLPDGRVPLASAVARWPTGPGAVRRVLEPALWQALAAARPLVGDALAEASGVWRTTHHPDAGAPLASLASEAEEVLALTDEVASAVATSFGVRDVGALLHALRVPALDGLFPPRERWRRLAADVRALQFERVLGARVRVERSTLGVTPRVRWVAPDPPRDVRLLSSVAEQGLISELAAAEGLGRGLAVALSSAGLPVELRWPVEATVPRALGGAFAQLLADRLALGRGRGLGAGDCEGVARHAGAMVLLETRACAAGVLWLAMGHTTDPEVAVDLLRRALAVDVDARLAPWLMGTPWSTPARFRGRLGGLAAWVALRERFDEDWYRNPRAAEAIRAGTEPGGRASAEGWLEADLGAPAHAHRLRLQELAAGQC